MRRSLAFLALAVGCGGGGGHDSPPDGDVSWANLGPTTELPVLAPANHASESSVAVHGDDVIVLAVHQQFPSADSFDYGTGALPRHVGAWVSHDRGATFAAPVDVAAGAFESTDPVVRVGADGHFWIGVINLSGIAGQIAALLDSTDGGDTWNVVNADVGGMDKDWIAADEAGGVYLCVLDLVEHFDAGGTPLAGDQTGGDSNCVGAYVDAVGRLHYMTMDGLAHVWDGVAAPTVEATLALGAAANEWTRAAGSIGPAPDGTWIVHGTHADRSPLLLVLVAADGSITSRELTTAGSSAFLPTAAVDENGLLHIVWYDSSGATGVVRYTHSVSADLTGPFVAPVTLDDDACPGDGWYPYSAGDPPPGGRRLREYIDIAVAGGRAHIAWTHAPDPPSRVFATYVDYD